MNWKVLHGDARKLNLPDKSVHLITCSPPYWQKRRYLDSLQEIGREEKFQDWVDNLVVCSREWRRVLRDDGLLFLNVSDGFARSPGKGDRLCGKSRYVNDDSGDQVFRGAPIPCGLKEKDLMLLPFRLAIALQDDGLWLRSSICWAKGVDWFEKEKLAQEQIRESLQAVRQEAEASLFGLSKEMGAALKKAQKAVDRLLMSGASMPESVTDRPSQSYEMIFMFSKSPRYFYDRYAISVPARFADDRKPYAPGQVDKRGTGHDRGGGRHTDRDISYRNARAAWMVPGNQFWRVATSPKGTFILPGGEEISHFASWPKRLVERMIKAGTSKGVCKACGAPMVRVLKKGAVVSAGGQAYKAGDSRHPTGEGGNVSKAGGQPETMIHRESVTVGWHPSCECFGAPAEGDIECPDCRGTGRQRVGVDYEGKWLEGNENDASRRLLAHTRAAREGGADHDVGAGDPVAVYAGDPCPSCLCPGCDGTGKARKSTQRIDNHFPESGKRPESHARGLVANLGENSMEYTDESCPACGGVGATGIVNGEVWPEEVLARWEIVPATVLDPMAGSGETGYAALGLGRSVILNDLSEKYVRLMRARMTAWPEDLPQKRSSWKVKEEELEDVLPMFDLERD